MSLAAFEAALDARGLILDGSVIDDGKFHRLKVKTERGHLRSNGWYVITRERYDNRDGWSGFYGRFDDGMGPQRWSDIDHRDTPLDPVVEKIRRREQRRLRAAERYRRIQCNHLAAEQATRMFAAARRLQHHPYLARKQVGNHGLRVARDGDLLIPIRDGMGRMMSLEQIGSDGGKWYLKGGRKAGGFHYIGDLAAKPRVVCVAEGYATAASIHEATGYPVATAMDGGNLMAVARVLRGKWPRAVIVLCADDDWKTEKNPGVKQASAAAAAVRGRIAIPRFGENRGEDDKDFNDLAVSAGDEAVKRVIERAIRTASS